MLTSTYKMPKELKRLLAATQDANERTMYKHIMFRAHIYAEEQAKQQAKRKKDSVENADAVLQV